MLMGLFFLDFYRLVKGLRVLLNRLWELEIKKICLFIGCDFFIEYLVNFFFRKIYLKRGNKEWGIVCFFSVISWY